MTVWCAGLDETAVSSKPAHQTVIYPSSYLPAYEDETECSETSAYKIQTPKNYQEESIQHSEHGKSLK